MAGHRPDAAARSEDDMRQPFPTDPADPADRPFHVSLARALLGGPACRRELLGRWRISAALRPWLIAFIWLGCAALFKAAMGATPAPAPAPASPPASDAQALTLVLPFADGSGPDAVARAIAAAWTDRTGEPVVLERRPGRQGYTAARRVASATPDGHTVLLTTSSLLERPPRVSDDLFSPKTAAASEFTVLARVGQMPFVSLWPAGQFAQRLNALPPPSLPAEALRVLSRRAMGASSTLETPPGHEDFDALDRRDTPDWNALLAPARLPAPVAQRLRRDWQAVLTDPRVRLALAQSGTELWEIVPAAETPPASTAAAGDAR